MLATGGVGAPKRDLLYRFTGRLPLLLGLVIGITRPSKACVRICENTTHGGMNRLKLPTAHFVSLQLQRTHCYPIVQRRLMAVIVPPAWKKDRTPVTSLWGPRASGWIGSVTASAGRGARPASSSPGTGRSSQTTYQIECIITESTRRRNCWRLCGHCCMNLR